jgi:hypothetical protein
MITETVSEKALRLLRKEAEDLSHGIVTLSLHFRDGKICRFVVNREVSVLADDSGARTGKGGEHVL